MIPQELFPSPLGPDPAVVLPKPLKVILRRSAPLPKVQFVVELVGPRSVPAALACHLLDPNWFQALGRPQAWCMGAMDDSWRELTTTPDGSYDSLALAWSLLEPPMTMALAKSLLARSEEYASHIQRRAMPMPMPEEVERQAKALVAIHEHLDIGFSLAFGPTKGFVSEKDLWVQCSRLGLAFGEGGAFEWRADGSDLPLLSVTPIGQTDAFSLAAVQRGDVHEGATIGFSFPLCPSPDEALEGCFHVGKVLCQALGGALYDEEGDPVGATTFQRLRKELNEGSKLFTKVGIEPGSSEAVTLWGA